MYNIVTYPDPVLRTRADEILEIDDELHEIIEEMTETMYVKDGVGLAANQIGLTKRLIIVDAGEGLMVLINPVLTVPEDARADSMDEGCLSLPDIRVDVTRPDRVHLTALDPDNKSIDLIADGLLARVLQHETDHLNGKMIIDHISSITRRLLRTKLRKLEKSHTEAS
ncbi:peptide deformylase [candidate division KSB1 bacterium]|nr:peptide deformylase [candidate division KSB1 bacterium]